MPKAMTPEETDLCREAVANKGMAFVSKDGRTCVVSYDGVNCFIYRGPDVNAMSQSEFEAFLERMNRE